MRSALVRSLARLALAALGARASAACAPDHRPGTSVASSDAGADGDAAPVRPTDAPSETRPTDAASLDASDAHAPTWCDSLSPRPAFCADFDGVDPWAGWTSPPLSSAGTTPVRWGFVGLTDAGASSPPFALDVTFLEDSAPPDSSFSRFTRGFARVGAAGTRRTTFAFDLTVLSMPGATTHDPILGGMLISPADAATPNRFWGLDLFITYPDDERRSWPFLAWRESDGAAPARYTASEPLLTGERTRVELSIARAAVPGRMDVELHLTPRSGVRTRVLHVVREDFAFQEDEMPGLYVENRIQTDSPRWRALWDNITLSVE